MMATTDFDVFMQMMRETKRMLDQQTMAAKQNEGKENADDTNDKK